MRSAAVRVSLCSETRFYAGHLLTRVLAVGTVILALWLAGCATTKSPQPDIESGLTPQELARAERIFRQLEQEYALHMDGKVMELAYELMDHYQEYPRVDEATLLATRAARRQGDLALGRRMAQEFLERYPDSESYPDMLTLGGDMAAADGDTAAAADLTIQLFDRLDRGLARRNAAERAQLFLEKLSAADLARLVSRHPHSGLGPYLRFMHARRLVEAGRQAEAGDSVAALRELAPESEWLTEAEKLLAETHLDGGSTPERRSATAVDPARIGILCPLTGRYAVFGNAFYDGASLAVRIMNSLGWRQFELVVEDTEGDPVSAALAARRLVDEHGVIALIGSLRSATTVAAAVVADVYRVPFVSPTAANTRIWKLGRGVFQTNQTGQFEATLLAQLATRVLLKEDFAILYADSPDGARGFQVFADEVRECGGTVVAAVSFAADATDFRIPLAEIKMARPEVVYVHASADQMRLLGPQLDFYQVNTLIMGPSSWNAPSLQRECGAIMERAIFPSETALFPADWSEHFHDSWQPEHLPADATPLALKAYEATRLVLDTIAQHDIEQRAALTDSLRLRLQTQQFDSTELAAFTGIVNMFSGGEIIDFPVDMFQETWQEVAALEADLFDLEDPEELEELAPGEENNETGTDIPGDENVIPIPTRERATGDSSERE
ncbi:MAG: ABC transporter substrate-binding protein [bacterium]